MERNRSYFILLLCAVLAALAQGSFFARSTLFGARPDLVLLLVVSAGLRIGYRRGAIIGFMVGVLFGFFSLEPSGAAALIYGLAGFLAGLVRNRTYPDEVVVPLETAVGATLVVFLLSYWILRALPLPTPASHMKLRLMGQLVLNLVFILPVHRLTGWILPPRRWDSFS